MDVITTRLADCIGPINKPLIAASKRKVEVEKVNMIASDDNINPINEKIITFLDPYLSLAIPPTIIGFFVLVIFGINGPIGTITNNLFGFNIIFTWLAATLVTAIISFPLMARAIIVSMSEVEPSLEKTALGLGAGPVKVFFSITMPLSYRGIVAGSLICFVRALSEFGATFTPKNKNFPPFKITSSEMPVGINYKAGVSAQLKSACILAALNSYGITNIVENRKIRSRDHTENILLANSDVIKIKKNLIKVEGKRFLEPINIKIPADPSSSAFFTAITLFSPGSKLKIKNVLLNPTRIGFYKLLKKHGANIKFKNIKKINNEVVGDIFVKASKIQPIKASAKYYPSTADEYPILFVIASLIKGVSVFNGISDLANKESSRAYQMKKILNQAGVKSKLTKDTMKIFGKDKIKSNGLIKLGKLNDHRLCMSLFCLSTITGLKSKIKSFETVFTSCPSFLQNIRSIGGGFHVKKN